MFVLKWIFILFMVVLIMNLGSGFKCLINIYCKCYDVGRKLFVDCFDLFLNIVLYF